MLPTSDLTEIVDICQSPGVQVAKSGETADLASNPRADTDRISTLLGTIRLPAVVAPQRPGTNWTNHDGDHFGGRTSVKQDGTQDKTRNHATGHDSQFTDFRDPRGLWLRVTFFQRLTPVLWCIRFLLNQVPVSN